MIEDLEETRKYPNLHISDYMNEQMNILLRDVTSLGLSSTLTEYLHWRGYSTIGKLAKLTIQDLQSDPDFTEKDCLDIIEKLTVLGIILPEIKSKKTKHAYHISKNHPYPQNLISEILGVSADEELELYCDADKIKGLAISLNMLNDREEAAIILRYKHLATYEQIGSYFGMSRESVRLFIKKAIRKLRHPRRSVLIRKGVNGYLESQAKEQTQKILHAEYERGYNDGVSVSKTSRPLVYNILQDATIEQLNLSIRSYRLLRRAGVKTVQDILLLGTIRLMSLEGMERKSFNEILSRLKELGISICDDSDLEKNKPLAISTKTSDWKCNRAPKNIKYSTFERMYTPKEIMAIKKGYRPHSMENKWFCVYQNGMLYFYRSWTGDLIYSIIINELTNQHVLLTYYNEEDTLESLSKVNIVELIDCMIYHWE